jgi:hypothetical protein
MKRAWVTVLNDTDEDVVCEIEAFTQGGDYLEESSPFVFGKSPDGYPKTGFKSNDPDDDDSVFDNSFEYVPKLANPNGYYVLQCYLPRMSKTHAGTIAAAYVVNYLIEEVSK